MKQARRRRDLLSWAQPTLFLSTFYTLSMAIGSLVLGLLDSPSIPGAAKPYGLQLWPVAVVTFIVSIAISAMYVRCESKTQTLQTWLPLATTAARASLFFGVSIAFTFAIAGRGHLAWFGVALGFIAVPALALLIFALCDHALRELAVESAIEERRRSEQQHRELMVAIEQVRQSRAARQRTGFWSAITRRTRRR